MLDDTQGGEPTEDEVEDGEIVEEIGDDTLGEEGEALEEGEEGTVEEVLEDSSSNVKCSKEAHYREGASIVQVGELDLHQKNLGGVERQENQIKDLEKRLNVEEESASNLPTLWVKRQRNKYKHVPYLKNKVRKDKDNTEVANSTSSTLDEPVGDKPKNNSKDTSLNGQLDLVKGQSGACDKIKSLSNRKGGKENGRKKKERSDGAHDPAKGGKSKAVEEHEPESRGSANPTSNTAPAGQSKHTEKLVETKTARKSLSKKSNLGQQGWDWEGFLFQNPDKITRVEKVKGESKKSQEENQGGGKSTGTETSRSEKLQQMKKRKNIQQEKDIEEKEKVAKKREAENVTKKGKENKENKSKKTRIDEEKKVNEGDKLAEKHDQAEEENKVNETRTPCSGKEEMREMVTNAADAFQENGEEQKNGLGCKDDNFHEAVDDLDSWRYEVVEMRARLSQQECEARARTEAYLQQLADAFRQVGEHEEKELKASEELAGLRFEVTTLRGEVERLNKEVEKLKHLAEQENKTVVDKATSPMEVDRNLNGLGGRLAQRESAKENFEVSKKEQGNAMQREMAVAGRDELYTEGPGELVVDEEISVEVSSDDEANQTDGDKPQLRTEKQNSDISKRKDLWLVGKKNPASKCSPKKKPAKHGAVVTTVKRAAEKMGKHEGKVKLVMRKGDLGSKVISEGIQDQQAAKARGEDNVCGHNAVSRMAQRQLASVRGKVKGCSGPFLCGFDKCKESWTNCVGWERKALAHYLRDHSISINDMMVKDKDSGTTFVVEELLEYVGQCSQKDCNAILGVKGRSASDSRYEMKRSFQRHFKSLHPKEVVHYTYLVEKHVARFRE